MLKLLFLVSGFALLIFLISYSLIYNRSTIPDSSQLITVISPSAESTSAILRMYEKDGHGQWSVIGKETPVKLGRGGLKWDDKQIPFFSTEDRKKEGDGASPAGFFPLLKVMSYENKFVSKMPQLILTEDIKCIDDDNSTSYNKIVDSRNTKNDWLSAETMRRKDNLYKYVIEVGYNQGPLKGKGSCIFLHIWRNSDTPTSGCTAMDEEDIKWLIQQLDPLKNPIIVQLTLQDYKKLKGRWMLP